MKIAIISGTFQPEFGGMAGHAYQVARYFAQKGHRITIFARKGFCSKLNESNINVTPLLSHRFPTLDCFLLRYKLKKIKPEWMHITEAGLAYRTITKRYPSLVRVVGNDFLKPWAGFNLPLRFLLYRIPSSVIRKNIRSFEVRLRRKIVINRLKRVPILTNSEWTRSKLIENGIPEKNIHAIPGGIDLEIFKPSVEKTFLRKKYGVDKAQTVFITVASLIEMKGHDVVIEAINRLIKKNGNLHYIIIGEGKHRSTLEKQVYKNKLNDFVRFTGRLNQHEVAHYYQLSDVYIQISRDVEVIPGILDNAETMGRTFIEAGACGLPVIASNIGGIPSVVKDDYNGILVQNPRDVKKIAEAMSSLAGDEKLRYKLGENGLKRAKEEFSWGIICQKIETLMKNDLKCKEMMET